MEKVSRGTMTWPHRHLLASYCGHTARSTTPRVDVDTVATLRAPIPPCCVRLSTDVDVPTRDCPLIPMWRYAVITLLREAARAGVLNTDKPGGALLRRLTTQHERWWNIDIKRFKSKKQFMGSAEYVTAAATCH